MVEQLLLLQEQLRLLQVGHRLLLLPGQLPLLQMWHQRRLQEQQLLHLLPQALQLWLFR